MTDAPTLNPEKGIVSFYEKPGCKGNAKQKKRLREAGYTLQVIDMVSKRWNEESLCRFIGRENLAAKVNPRAPQILHEGWSPEGKSDEEILAAMLASPILIKRPLLFHRGAFGVGFDSPLVAELLGDVEAEMACHNGKHECVGH